MRKVSTLICISTMLVLLTGCGRGVKAPIATDNDTSNVVFEATDDDGSYVVYKDGNEYKEINNKTGEEKVVVPIDKDVRFELEVPKSECDITDNKGLSPTVTDSNIRAIAPSTYECSLSQSGVYIEYLKNIGYEVISKFVSSEFETLYMQGSDSIIRLDISDGKLIVFRDIQKYFTSSLVYINERIDK